MKNPITRKSFKKRLLWQILTFVVVIMVVMTVMLTFMLSRALTGNLKNSLSVIAYHHLENMEHRISFLVESISNFSNNHFVINSLIDPQGRTLYLPRLVQDFSATQDVYAVTIVDFDGNIICSSLENPPDYRETANLRATLAVGERIIQFSENQKNIVCIDPIEYYQTPQGAAIVELSLTNIISHILPKKKINSYTLYSKESVLLSQKAGDGGACITVSRQAGKDLAYMNRLGTGIEIGVLKAMYLAPVRSAIVQLMLTGGMFIVVAIIIAVRMGNGIARPILKLCEKVRKTERFENERCSPIGTADELEELAQAFDNRTDWLLTAMNRLKENSDELRVTNEKLKQEITNHELAEKRGKHLEVQLRQAQKMESIGTLAGGIAHDFNNILFPILGYAEMSMSSVPEDSVARKNLEEILKAANRAANLVKQILAFSRQKEQEHKPFKIQFVIKEALTLLRASIPKSIEFIENIDNDCGPVLGDSNQFHQIIINLCTNAFHAMEETGGRLEVNLTDIDIGADEIRDELDMKPGRYARLAVSDTGCGMGTEVLERIFDPYFTTKAPGKGTGMGLPVVHGIVKAHGGAIKVYSKLGNGTTFHVYLPIVDTVGMKTEVGSYEKKPMGKEKILLIDDEVQIVYMVQQMLERLGYHVTAQTSSIEALEVFRSRPEDFELVITDQTMPNMMGTDLAKELIEIRPDIPVILCTGFSETITEEKAKAMGIREYVMKPIVISRIANTIRKVLDEEAVRSSISISLP